MPEHAFDFASLLRMLQHRLALEIIEAVSYSNAGLFFPLGLFRPTILHVLLVLIALFQLNLDRDEEESHSFEHHGGQTAINTVLDMVVSVGECLAKPEEARCDPPDPLESNSFGPSLRVCELSDGHLVDQLQQDV